jgi:hypothetical protein
MTRRETVHSEISQSEKRDIVENDRRVHKATYFSHTHPDEGGRFAASDQPPRHVVGSTPVPRYPAGPNWSADPTGVEPPTGIAIDQMDPVGETFEVERSLCEVRNGAAPPTEPLSASPNDEVQAPLGSNSLPRRLSRPRRVSKKG